MTKKVAMRNGAIIVLCLLGAAAAMLYAASPKILGGPFVVDVTSQTATVAWVVENDTVSVRASGKAAVTSPSFRVEHTTLTGLKPDTRYDYDIASDSPAGKGYFKTPPSEPGAPSAYSFVVYGDNRTRPDVHRRVIEALIKHSIPDFVVQTGDMVANGDDTLQWSTFLNIEHDLLRQTAFFPAMGNHEHETHYFRELFHDGPSYYSFDWGNAHFSVLDSDIVNTTSDFQVKHALWGEQTRWLEEDLKHHQDSVFRFVVAHHPPFTAVKQRQGANEHMTALAPMLEKYHVTAGLFGHDHNYQHYLKNGIHYVTSGGGGAPLYDVDMPPAGITQRVVSMENFVSVTVDGKTARFQAISIDGKVLDQFVVEH